LPPTFASGCEAPTLVLFLAVVLWKGTAVALRRVTVIAAAIAAAISLFMVGTGLGSGRAALLGVVLVLVAAGILMMGILARVTAGSAVPWLFYVSAIGGGLVGRQAGGGVMVAAIAIVSALVGRRALQKTGYDPLVSRWIDATASLGGTRFRGADLKGAKLHGAMLRNADFRDANIDEAQLGEAGKVEGCVFGRGRAEGRQGPSHPAARP
jgi:Pentapeptide repeats (8 copies)